MPETTMLTVPPASAPLIVNTTCVSTMSLFHTRSRRRLKGAAVLAFALGALTPLSPALAKDAAMQAVPLTPVPIIVKASAVSTMSLFRALSRHRSKSPDVLGFALSAATLFFSSASSSSSLAKDAAMTPNPKQQVVDLLKSIETGNAGPVAYINPANYKQHNLAVGDGLAGFGAVLAQLPKGSAKVNTVRVFQDGDHVFAHTEYNFFGPKIGFDVFRFEDGRIVEHWDNLQVTPAHANPSGRTMTDGETRATDLHLTDTNKALVKRFVDDILVNGRMALLPSYFDGDNYLQHNPQIGDKLSGLGVALAAMAKQGLTMKYDTVHKVLGEGNFVLTLSEGQFAGRHVAFYDLFRVQNGKIAEHWDTIEEIPERAAWKNANGKF